jgi:hypothetical protein
MNCKYCGELLYEDDDEEACESKPKVSKSASVPCYAPLSHRLNMTLMGDVSLTVSAT